MGIVSCMFLVHIGQVHYCYTCTCTCICMMKLYAHEFGCILWLHSANTTFHKRSVLDHKQTTSVVSTSTVHYSLYTCTMYTKLMYV